MSVLRVRRRRGVAPRNRANLSKDADRASVMEGSRTVEKPLGMSLRDQDESDIETSSRLTPESEEQDVIALPNGSDSSDNSGKDEDEAAAIAAPAAMPVHSAPWPAPPVTTPESAAIAAKRAQLQAALRDRPRWMARPITSAPLAQAAEPAEANQPVTVAEAPAEMPGKMPDQTISPYSPPDWKAVFGDHEEVATEDEIEHEDASDEPSEQVEAEALDEPELPYLGDTPSETATEQAFADLC